MNYEIIKASSDNVETLTNLMQFYIYDFSEFIEAHVGENGRFDDYPLNNYWTEDNHFPYLVRFNGNYAGFVLVKWIKTETISYFSIAEFFIMKKYRRSGLGKSVAKDIFRLHKGNWVVFQMEKNERAQLFWRNVIKEYTGGRFTERVEEGKRIFQEFSS
ncbi:GNAT family N-acetyltransferase [Bacillus sp. FJAT-49731]|uniref:GNAT family N-acetyltransferase n=1 Tax=Lederbergia citrea TaxID=2833581 RepID=A0A942UJN6_9BACI|nr:GNAT family N-acetyltransferase [Lederbergia citrea]MBS4203412.1 GNAT family N-acetyltransferase [Lederbergia citrea]MBS4221915.1 GNAT family N-acetyltransferase [Lederbergia citrea]